MENITKYLIKSTVKKSEVKAWEETVMLPTYEIGKEEKNPVFIEKRVYIIIIFTINIFSIVFLNIDLNYSS